MMHKIMMVLVVALLAVGGYFGYQRYMNQDNVRIQACASCENVSCGSYSNCICGKCE